MVFVLEVPEPAQLAHPQVGIILLPGIERRLAHAELPADVPDRGAALDLAQRVGDLLLGELRALHRSPPVCGGPPKRQLYSSFALPSFAGETSDRRARGDGPTDRPSGSSRDGGSRPRSHPARAPGDQPRA